MVSDAQDQDINGNRDDKYTLKGTVEMDEAFFETVDPDQLNAPIKRGRGSQKQSAVMVIAESEEVDEKKMGKHRKKEDVVTSRCVLWMI